MAISLHPFPDDFCYSKTQSLLSKYGLFWRIHGYAPYNEVSVHLSVHVPWLFWDSIF